MQLKRAVILMALLLGVAVAGLAQTNEQTQTRADLTQDITFKSLDGKDGISHIARTLGLKVVFDESARHRGKLDFSLQHATVRQALSVVLVLLEWRAKQLDAETLVVFADTPEARQQYTHLPDWSHKLPAVR